MGVGRFGFDFKR